MDRQGIGIVLIYGLALLLAVLTGRYLCRVFGTRRPAADWLSPLENRLFRLSGIDPSQPMRWQQYALTLLTLNGLWLVYAFVLLLFQTRIPIANQGGIQPMDWTLALNTAISFLTSTNLQHYAGETGVTYFTQLAVLTFLQFVSAATSLAVGVAVVRCLQTGSGAFVGNAYQDMVRALTRVLLPLSVVAAGLLLTTGVPMSLSPYTTIQTLQGDTQTIAGGPVAAMLPIKHLGSNGGGFFGTNTAHPLENPSYASYIVHLIDVLLLPMAFVCFVGFFLRRRRLGVLLFTIMTVGWLLITLPIIQQELAGNPALTALGIDQSAGSLEGKEVRFGTLASAFYCGVNAVIPAGTLTSMHDSYTPLSGLFMLLGMQLDALYGGVGSGFLYLFLYIVLALFVGSLMTGRTPELLGKKIGLTEMQLAVGILVLLPLLYLGGTGVAVALLNANPDLGWLSNPGYHGFTTMLYEYVSSAAGNGSGFEGLADNTPFWNLSTTVVMAGGRFVPLLGPLAIAGILYAKPYTPPSAGVLPIDSVTFGVLLAAIMLITGALCFFPALAIGPLAEYLTQHP